MKAEIVETFLEPLASLLADPEVSEVVVNPGPRVFAERRGELSEAPGIPITAQQVEILIRVIARSVGQQASPERPILEARLPDGSRFTGVLSPPAVDGPCLAIRKFHRQYFSIDELLCAGSLTPEARAAIEKSINRRGNILIGGATSSGKTTLVNALAALIPDDERIVVVEDTPELRIAKPNVVGLEARAPQDGIAGASVRALVRTALRLRPDRLLIGEIRGAEAFDLLQALNTGHAGSFSTIHASSGRQALARLETCVLEAASGLPIEAIRGRIADAIDMVVHTERLGGRRFVSEVLRVGPYDYRSGRYECETRYSSGPKPGGAQGER